MRRLQKAELGMIVNVTDELRELFWMDGRPPDSSTGKKHNREVRARNGNNVQQLRILHWNMGSKEWKSKTVEIEALLVEKQPDMCFISEANLEWYTNT